ncbi:MAG: hypothetical protein IJC26_03815, partial [Clostridia bacterium]|nr:hypothetical protein [Clostridia bacterium]
MKRFFAILLTLSLALSLFSCGGGTLEPLTKEDPQTASNQTEETDKIKETESMETKEIKETVEAETGEPYAPPTDSESVQHPLDGKKFIFIGNSYTFYGKCVLEKKTTVRSQAERSHDKGYFYQIAKENGADIEVTNWTYGNHCLEDTFGGNCNADRGCNGHDHTTDLTDRYFDYVMFQESSK